MAQVEEEQVSFAIVSAIYLRSRIDAQGLDPMEEKVQTIQQARAPTTVSKLKSYLGAFAKSIIRIKTLPATSPSCEMVMGHHNKFFRNPRND